MAGKKSVLSSLAVYAEDSEPESDGEAGVETAGSAAEEKGGLVSDAYGEDDFSRLGGDEDGYEEEEEENSKQSEDDDSETEKPEADDPKVVTRVVEAFFGILNSAFKLEYTQRRESFKDNPEVEKRDPQELVASFSERVRNMSPDEIKIPPEPPGRCSNHLQDKIQKLYERKMKEGMDMNYMIQRKKEFRNPSIYEKLIQFCAIDELGTNYPKDMFDPHGWSEDSYYEALAKAQKVEMDKLEKAKKERTKIEFVTGTKKGTTTNATATTTTTASTAVADAQKRKSKWDSAIPVTTIAQPTILTTTATLPAVVTVTTSASGSKTTVISAVGTIVKKAKQ
ncbi:SAP30-binding protein isoform X3 [Myotis yumanensis]|uniref:SAP30-binding protein isoform X2 n=1 Tax=Myotis lucifugus TaxID=59463 RepID=UPI0006D71630|nr:SAP30-binding protein isoform X2 [Myotis lucifugus]XP_014387264.1 PREDICTED: SAP30-binding protein isoform X2 [Myotis brandtii]XP_036195286.1 SAP30-binding protein isoform X3 [Myotis myotis]XP_059527232.1 SAP30-binding protein isoform X1 [Myotis daubentonii]